MTITIKIRKSKFIGDDFSAYVSFPYNENIINTIRGFKRRSWIKGTKQWEIPINNVEFLMNEYPHCNFDISGHYVDMSPIEVIKADSFNFKTKCFEHQIKSFEYGMAHNRWLLGDEQGLGKTKQVIDIAVAKKQTLGYKHCLIICAVNGLKWNWREEVAKHSNEKSHILGQKVRRNGEVYIGSNKDKLADIKRLDSLDSYFIITNIETLRDNAIASEIESRIHSNDIQMIAVDEINLCKNPASQQGKELIRLDSECRIAMTGTPLMNSPLDLYIILRWLGYEKHAFYTFKHYYAVYGGYGGYQIIGYKHLDELEEQLQEVMLRRLKDDVLDLPEKTYIDEYVDMLPKQAVVYKEVKADIKSNIDMISVAPNPLAEMIRLRQATGYTGILSSEIQCSAKLDRMEEIIDDAVSNNRKVIVFSNWTSMTNEIADRLKEKHRFVQITGETKDSLRQANINAFQENDNVKVIIGTSGAMGSGLNLFAASVVIFLDHPWSRALYDQCVDRAHRVGQKNKITIYNIMCKNTIDEKIWKLVKDKGEMSDKIVDGRLSPIDKKELVDYLLS